MTLELQPITQREADRFITEHHRHHPPSRGWKFGIAVASDGVVVGVIVVGRPVAASFDDGWTAEATRCCTDGTKNAASMLYGAACRAAMAMGYRRLITYTMRSEPGTSLRAAGWTVIARRPARSWAKESGRPRVDRSPVEERQLWEASI